MRLSTFFYPRFYWIIVAQLISFAAFSQNYSIKGKVLDANTNEPLPGATVAIENTALGTTTDNGGAFELSGIREKIITINISYIGYETNRINHDFSSRKTPDFTVRLASSSIELTTVEVEGIAEGQIKAFLEQKQAESIKNVISAEQIITFPDLNAAEVMQRIPGITLQRDQGEGRFVQLRGTPPELTNFNVNGEQIPSPEGDVRYVGMDIIPADQIEFIEVNKVMTPDMDADGIGGSVNIKTKEALNEVPDIGATLSGGYNNLRGTANYQMQFSYGQRYKKLGFQVNSSFFQNNQGSDNIEYNFAKGPFFGSQNQGVDNYSVQYREVQLRHYDITRTRISVSPTLDFKFNKNSFLYLRGMYNSFVDNEIRRRKIYDLDDALSETYYLYGGIEHDVRDRTKRQELNTLNFGGEHKIWGATLDYQIFYALAKDTEPGRIEALFDSPGQAIAIRFDNTDPDYPRATFPNPNNAGNATDYDNFELDELLFEESETRDVNITPRINITLPYDFSNVNKGYFKFGGKIRMKEKERNIQSQQFGAYFEQTAQYPGVGPKLSLASVNDGFRDENLLDQGYLLEYMPSADKLRDFYEFYPQHFIFDRNATRTQSFGEDYKADETIYAAYGMFRHDFRRLMVLGGLRFERTKIDYEGAKILLNGNRFVGIDTLTDQRTHEFLLPQIQFKYTINDRFNLRTALTYTYSRPNFEDVLPYREQDREEVKFGNPDLRYPRSTNVDFLAERYFRKGILSGGVFYKKIDDFIFFFKRFAHEGDPKDFSLVEITKAINGIKASVYGAEFQAQFKFDFLKGFFSNFGLYTNYTYTYSEAFINKRFPANYTNAVVVFGEDDLSDFTSSTEKEKISLPGQAQHTTNLALFYDSKKFFARLTANYQDAFLQELGADADLDEYYDQNLRFDFTMNYQLTKGINVFVDWINITNTPLRFYLGTPDRIKQQEFYSWWSRIGVRLNY
ncbi:MAG: TonB-dependent receptor [Saprospiraceae bacterium]|nr:TonB-dependent receptor [Saprospiraceae bacterium]